MAILYDPLSRIFHLQSKDVSYALGIVKEGYLAHLYWGKKINGALSSRLLGSTWRPSFSPTPYSEDETFSLDTLPQEYPAYGTSDFRSPAYQVQLTNGSTISELLYVSHEMKSGKPKLDGLPAIYTESDAEAETLEILVEDAVAGLQLLVNGAPSGVYAVVQKAYINFVVPWSAPTSGNAEFLLFNPTTREIVAAGTVLMSVADPAFKTVNAAGTGQVLAVNVTEGGLNGPQNPVNRGNVLQLALTGQGLVNNPPPDGVAPSGFVPTNPADLHIFINAQPVPAGNILFSGLDPTYPGSWIINVKVPDVSQGGPPPGNNITILVTMRDVASNYGFDPSNSNNDIQLLPANGRITTIAVK